jgi:hypothetical protein
MAVPVVGSPAWVLACYRRFDRDILRGELPSDARSSFRRRVGVGITLLLLAGVALALGGGMLA